MLATIILATLAASLSFVQSSAAFLPCRHGQPTYNMADIRELEDDERSNKRSHADFAGQDGSGTPQPSDTRQCHPEQ